MTHLTPIQRLMLLMLATTAEPVSIADVAASIGSTPRPLSIAHRSFATGA
jgi:transcriptional regulator GlxA family with amidase domain